MGDAAESFKGPISILDSVNFTWTIAWQGGSHSALHRLRVNDALRKNRRIPMPPGWEVASKALKLAEHARDISQKSLPLDVCKLNCKLLGVPKRFDLLQNDLVPGACVALMVNGRRVNYVLVAHVYGDVWRCSPGALMHNGRILQDTVWRRDDCKTKNIVEEAYSGVAPKRRMHSHIMTDHLQQLLCEHADSFFDLVANEVWFVEECRARKTKQALDVNAASACFETNPFIWEHVGGHISQNDAYFVWSWEYKGELQFSKQATRLDHAIHGDVPLPKELFTDLALLERLLRRAGREAKQTYCTCTYLGVQVGPNKFEPDPARWHEGGWKSRQQIWIEYKHIRNAETNKAHRVLVCADGWLCDRSPGHPLYETSSRTLRFSIDFMDAFAQNRLDGMTFLGVCYENQERPEILRHLPNNIDIQNEKFWWQLPSGETICKSLIELRDGKLDMILPEESAEACEKICLELGYEKLGVPASADGVLKFEEYRQSKKLGSLIVASVPRATCYPRGISLAHFTH